jgi:phenylpropionate dioxygenase-like ring-hydroxylating dioxygenase large terminal subunit
VSRRGRQRRDIHLRLSRLDISQRWAAGRRTVPQEAYHGELQRERFGLTPVAQLDSYKGLLFATFDAEAPTLREYLGEMTWYLDAFFDRREGGIRGHRRP